MAVVTLHKELQLRVREGINVIKDCEEGNENGQMNHTVRGPIITISGIVEKVQSETNMSRYWKPSFSGSMLIFRGVFEMVAQINTLSILSCGSSLVDAQKSQ